MLVLCPGNIMNIMVIMDNNTFLTCQMCNRFGRMNITELIGGSSNIFCVTTRKNVFN